MSSMCDQKPYSHVSLQGAGSVLQGSVKGRHGVFWSQLEQRKERQEDHSKSLCVLTHTSRGNDRTTKQHLSEMHRPLPLSAAPVRGFHSGSPSTCLTC